jgi:hypothetical protein
MDIEAILFREGIATWLGDIVTSLPADNNGAGSQKFQIGKNLATNIGFIYGLSMYADGTDPNGTQLITTTQAQNMYLGLYDGATNFIQYLRLSDLLNEFAGSPIVRAQKYLPVNVPVFDLSQSDYYNPNVYVNATLRLKLWYITNSDFDKLKATGFFRTYKPKPKKE